ncbi:MAG: hypothetical protein ACODAU_10665 [Myxococcota bacterium]
MRIDLADADAEADAVERALSEAGFDVRRVEPEALRDAPTSASLVVLAGDAPSALSVLDHLRRTPETATVPVLLVGRPPEGPGDDDTLRSLGADAVYPRPVPVVRLVRKVQTFVTPAEQLRSTADPETVAPGAASSAPEPPPARPSAGAEPTLRLAEEADAWHADAWVDDAPRSGPGHGLSPRVLELLREADRRLFPDSPALDLTFADPGEALELLLAEDLLEPVPLPEAHPPVPPDEVAPAGPAARSLADATTAIARASERTPREVPSTPGSGVGPAGSWLDRLRTGLLAADLADLVLAGARRRYDRDEVTRRLGRGGEVRVAPDAPDLMAELGCDASLRRWVLAHDGSSVEAWCAEDPPGGGAPGLLLALAAFGVLAVDAAVDASAGRGGSGRAAARARVAAAAALARDGDYFAILGVPPDAGPEEIRGAFEARQADLLGAGTLPGELERARAEALRALEEARSILLIDRLRRAYRRALAMAEGA